MTDANAEQGYFEKARRFLASARLLLADGDIDYLVNTGLSAAEAWLARKDSAGSE